VGAMSSRNHFGNHPLIVNCKMIVDPLEQSSQDSQCLLFEFACFLLISLLYAHIYIYFDIVKLQIIKNRQLSR